MEELEKRNIRLFHVYRFVSRFYMYLPILVVILISFKLTYIQISLVVAIHGIFIMVFKIFLKSIMKRVQSAKYVVCIGEITKSAGILILALSQGNFVVILIAQMINGIGFALTTSTESMLIYSTLQAYGKEHKYRIVEARSQAVSFVSVFIAGIVGSILAKTNLQVPLYISAAAAFVSCWIIFAYRENLQENKVEKNDEVVESEIKSMRHVLLYYAFNRAIILTLFVYAMPLVLLETYDINIVYFGAILGLFSLTAYIAGNTIERIAHFFKGGWVLVSLLLFISIILLCSGNIFALLLSPILMGFSGVLVRPISMAYINERVTTNRVLVMSRGEQYFGLFNAVFVVVLGMLFSLNGLMYGMTVFATTILTGYGILVIYARRKNKSVVFCNCQDMVECDSPSINKTL